MFAQNKGKVIAPLTEIILMADHNKPNGEHGSSYGTAARLAIDSRTFSDALQKIGELHALIPSLKEEIERSDKRLTQVEQWQATWISRFTGKARIAFAVGFLCGAWSLIDLIVRVWPLIGRFFAK